MKQSEPEAAIHKAVRSVADDLVRDLEAARVRKFAAVTALQTAMSEEARIKHDLDLLLLTCSGLKTHKMLVVRSCSLNCGFEAHPWSVDGETIWCPGRPVVGPLQPGPGYPPLRA